MKEAHLHRWKEQLQRSPSERLSIEPAESLTPEHQAPWKNWLCFKRLRTGVLRKNRTLAKWSFHSGTALCNCGSSEDRAEHVLTYPLLSQVCTIQDLSEYNIVVKETLELWKDFV